MKVVAIAFHSVAVASTVFRLVYRWWMARFWWEDGWAALALLCDIVSLVSAVMVPPHLGRESHGPAVTISGWMAALSLAAVLWAARLSILLSIMRIGNPSKTLRRICIAMGFSFMIMFLALQGQRVELCITVQCRVFKSTAVSQLITDIIADLGLVALPIWLLREAKLSWTRRILIQSVFSASICITIITIIHSVILLSETSSGTLFFGHFKSALSLLICNLLVIITFIYRVCHRDKIDLEQMEPVFPRDLTTVDLYMNTGTNTNTNTHMGFTMDGCDCWTIGTGTNPMCEVTTSVYTVTVAPGSGPRAQEQEQDHQVARSQSC